MRKPIIWAYSYSGPCANMNQGSFIASRYFFNFNTNGQSCCHSSTVGETVNNNHYTETCTKHILLPHTYIWAVLKVRFVFTSAPNSGMNWMSTCILLNSAPHQIWMFASNSLHEKQWNKQRWLRLRSHQNCGFFYQWCLIQLLYLNFWLVSTLAFCLQCFDAVGWAAGRASGL